MTDQLVALLGGRAVGHVRRDRRGRLSFIYNDDWRDARGAYPLSVSMPLAAAEHGHAAVEAFLWGLLPDNEFVLDRWARKFHVSARNAFALISHVGEDCAGAAQFVRSERFEAYVGTDPGAVEWLDELGVAERLRMLRADHSAWRAPRDTGQFSLAGAQPKTALLLENGRWGVPSGRVPTTHILKPPTGEFDGHAENEHLCLKLAGRLGMPTVSSDVMRFEDQTAIVVERYDRRHTKKGLIRVHQEDICQALSVLPTRKYENEGGPGPRAVIDLLREYSGAREEDVSTFVDALAFNWLIAGTDAHAKNYSVLIGPSGRVRLAPLYDLASALPYDDIDIQKLKLAMKIGRNYRLRDVGPNDWRRFAMDVRLDPDAVVGRLAVLAEQLPDDAIAVRDDMKSQGLDHPLIGRLADRLASRATVCLKSFQVTSKNTSGGS
ncbi:type II toxin-antitoxin system HipA family toxin [Pelagibius sp.]|uniref:type II toxin-antitoxin system HipA family toxin n=1 Tax=Pelagibius sp. TaxID=1931238 RepID=UPI003B50949D